jgi:hypothetical protein
VRTLILYSNRDGQVLAYILEHGESFDTADHETIAGIKDRLAENRLTTNAPIIFVELPDGFRPTLTDEYGDEIPVQFGTADDY